MRAYLDLFTHRSARWPLLTSTVSRLTPGMIVLAIAYLLRDGEAYSWSAAGVVAAAHQLGVGAGSPFQGKLVDRFGQPRVLVPDAVGYLLGTASLAWLVGQRASVVVLVVVAVLSGAMYPPVTACSRVLLSGLFPTGQLRETAFALSAVAVEIGFILGPLAAILVASRFGAGWSVVLAGAAAFVGAVGYSATQAARDVPLRDPATGRGGALRSRGIRVMAVAFGTIAVAFGVFDIVIPAVAELADQREAAWWLIASIASGSLLGGLVYGSRVWPGTVVQRLRVLVTVLVVGLAAIPFALGSLPTFAVTLFLGGLFLGPTTICAFQLIDDLALPGTQTEAQSWTQASITAGVALGASSAGIAIDRGGPAMAFLLGAVAVAMGAIVINGYNGRLRDTVRGSDHIAVPALPERPATA